MERVRITDIVDPNKELRPLDSKIQAVMQGMLDGLSVEQIASRSRVYFGEVREIRDSISSQQIAIRVVSGELKVSDFPSNPLERLTREESWVWVQTVRGLSRERIQEDARQNDMRLMQPVRVFEVRIGKKWAIDGQYKRQKIVAYGVTALMQGQDFLYKPS